MTVALITLVATACSPTPATELYPPAQSWPEQRELVYGWLGEGDPAVADLIQDGVWEIPRFEPVIERSRTLPLAK